MRFGLHWKKSEPQRREEREGKKEKKRKKNFALACPL
jgi:hypothetical protein